LNHEQKVREFFDDAVHCYGAIMGDRWHHGDPAAEAGGMPFLRACEVLEEKVAALAAIGPGKRVLDFGSGVGGPTLHMAKVTRATFVGITNNEGLSQRARKNAQDKGLADHASFVTIGDLDYRALPMFADASFDAVTFFESVCHVPDKAAFFRAAYRVLKPGGWIAGTDWMQREFGDLKTREQIMKFIGPMNEYIYLDNVGSVADYRRYMEDAGFHVKTAVDQFEGVKCWGSTPPEERPQWLEYDGPRGEVFRKGKLALDAAREAGVFTVGTFQAKKPE
jgi:ubiquinone/menaquinone biosynthesis C-methylase UbiE